MAEEFDPSSLPPGLSPNFGQAGAHETQRWLQGVATDSTTITSLGEIGHPNPEAATVAFLNLLDHTVHGQGGPPEAVDEVLSTLELSAANAIAVEQKAGVVTHPYELQSELANGRVRQLVALLHLYETGRYVARNPMALGGDTAPHFGDNINPLATVWLGRAADNHAIEVELEQLGFKDPRRQKADLTEALTFILNRDDGMARITGELLANLEGRNSTTKGDDPGDGAYFADLVHTEQFMGLHFVFEMGRYHEGLLRPAQPQ